jgi:hypothetical protein
METRIQCFEGNQRKSDSKELSDWQCLVLTENAIK